MGRLKRDRKNITYLPTGIECLDKHLDGGIPIERLSLIYGVASTGKTTLMLQVSYNTSSLGFKVLYIDADKSFSHERFSQIAGLDWNTISKNVTIFQPETFEDQTNIIENLEKYLNPRVILVVVDSITTLYRATSFTAEERFSLNRELARQLAYLSSMAVKYRTAVLISSQVHLRLDSSLKFIEPVARRSLLHWSSNIIKLENTIDPAIKEVYIERAFKKKANICFKIKMQPEGLIQFVN